MINDVTPRNDCVPSVSTDSIWGGRATVLCMYCILCSIARCALCRLISAAGYVLHYQFLLKVKTNLAWPYYFVTKRPDALVTTSNITTPSDRFNQRRFYICINDSDPNADKSTKVIFWHFSAQGFRHRLNLAVSRACSRGQETHETILKGNFHQKFGLKKATMSNTSASMV